MSSSITLGAAFVHLPDDPIGVEGLVGDERSELNALDQRRHTDRVIAVAGQQFEAHQIAQRIGKGKDLRRPTALRCPYRLTLRPPLAPCPWR